MTTPNPEHVTRLRRWQRRAVNICDAGRCDACRKPGLLFYTDDYDYSTYDGGGGKRVYGGYWCPRCDFGNAGGMLLTDFESAEKVDTADE